MGSFTFQIHSTNKGSGCQNKTGFQTFKNCCPVPELLKTIKYLVMCHSYLTVNMKQYLFPPYVFLRWKKKNLKSGKNETGNGKELNIILVQSQSSQMNKNKHFPDRQNIRNLYNSYQKLYTILYEGFCIIFLRLKMVSCSLKMIYNTVLIFFYQIQYYACKIVDI